MRATTRHFTDGTGAPLSRCRPLTILDTASRRSQGELLRPVKKCLRRACAGLQSDGARLGAAVALAIAALGERQGGCDGIGSSWVGGRRTRRLLLLAGVMFAGLPGGSALADTTVGQTGTPPSDLVSGF